VISRRDALKGLGVLAATAAGCRKTPPEPPTPQGRIHGNDASAGHRVRSGDLPAPSSTVERTVLIVGGGVAGLSAAWRLAAAGVDDIEVVELAPTVGGTARAGKNEVSAFPWGAHYLPVPNPESRIVLRLCEELGICAPRVGSAPPTFDARHLVFEPENRLFFRGKWYPGLYLTAGASSADVAERAAFDAYIDTLRAAKGRDGRPAFAIPAALSSTDPEFTRLDTLTFAAHLAEKGWTSDRLRWTLDYACRDDYGAGCDTVSAWAGLHYFAGRRPWDTPATRGTVYFSWPEGNARLVAHLRARAPRITCGRIVYRVGQDGTADAFDLATEKSLTYRAQHIICATPNHVTQAITRGQRRKFADHAPWVVANLTLSRRPARAEPCWNSVLVDSQSLGYVEATHQDLGADHQAKPTVWTWYRAYDLGARAGLLAADWKTLTNTALDDLRRAHPDIRDVVRTADIWRWGHGTIIPRPGVMFGPERAAHLQPMGRVRFAHTDLSGLPLFEEAQYRGVFAAEQILTDLGITHETWA